MTARLFTGWDDKGLCFTPEDHINSYSKSQFSGVQEVANQSIPEIKTFKNSSDHLHQSH